MKKIHIPISLLMAAVTLVSCEDFLTKKPETSLSPGTYFSSDKELELWTNKFYSDIVPEADDEAVINADDNGSTSSLSALQKGTRTPSSKSWSNSTWKPLRDINYMLENMRCEDAGVRARYEGVAYFFRAWFYYNKVRQYGDIPWYDHVIGSSDTEDLNKPRDPRGYVMLKVLQDLDRAYELLPAKWPSDAVYRVSKDAALALKSRAALYEGTFRKYHAGTAFVPVDEQTFDNVTVSSEWFLGQAADAAGKMLGTRKLYTGNTFGLSPRATDASYREYFLLEDAESDETILSERYNVDLKVRHGIQFTYKANHRSATVRMVNHYLQKDGKPIQERQGWETMQFYESFIDRDPRMAQTIQGPSTPALEIDAKTGKPGPVAQKIDFERTFNGYRIVKYISDSGHEGASTSTTDYPLFRYAEVLLNYAEAKAELGQLTDDDVQKTIDVIRARVGMPAMAKVPTTVDPLMAEYYPNAKGTQKAAILEVRRERTVELICEGFRQWDLLRWGEGKWLTPKSTGGVMGIYLPGLGEYDLDKDGKIDLCIYQGTKPSTTAPAANTIEIAGNYSLSNGTSGYLTYYAAEDYVWDEGRDYLWPIPADQRSLTHGALTQNPGWDDGVNFD
ncbi:MAG: RagB/SusD family nutrient uptake outer membrane protein [Bacteroidales bacterium]|nr:RagB/SusD family nutrient uptake outer membrane protein [Bacteroidales bacterium]